MSSVEYNIACSLMQRIVVPLVLLICALLRPVGISYVYLLMFFLAPFVPVSTIKNFRGSVSAYFIIFISLSVILILCHTALQITIIVQGYDDIIGSPCSFTELLLRHIGFISFIKLSLVDIIKWIAPEVITLISSIFAFVVIKSQTLRVRKIDNISQDFEEYEQVPAKFQKGMNFNVLYKLGPPFSILCLFVAATLRPSIIGLIHFLVFLASGTYWATFKTLNRGFAKALQFSMFILVCHIIIIITYQTPWPQQYFKTDGKFSSILALESLIKSDCENDIRVINYNNSYNLDSFLLPIVILISYQILALTSKHLLTMNAKSGKNTSTSNIPLENLTRVEGENVPKISMLEQIFYGIKSVAGFIHENSYIFTNVLMMIWSIVYHSWLSFVFLLWANVLWMIPNQRKAMMRSSPVIVFYAEILLILDYIYAVYVTEISDSDLSQLNIQQIGLNKPHEVPIVNFLIKTIFTLIFWITLRQTCKESIYKRKSSILEYVSKAQSDSDSKGEPEIDDKSPSLFLKKSGDNFKNLLVRLWIWLLLIIIFMCGITGKAMTAFRICYMALFLFFLLAFQTSTKAWLRLMYGFWIFLIFYAMSILIMIYTYQFDNFNEYWRIFLNMSEGLQDDVGLEKYQTKDLFLHLVSPTAIVILTVIQVHYFHKRLVDSLELKSEIKDSTAADNLTTNDEEINEEETSIFRYSKQWFIFKLKQSHLFVKNLKEFIWLFLELHLIKIVYIAAFLCSVTEVCVLHIVIVILCVTGVVCEGKIQTFLSRVISFIVALIILTKMIYQVSYLDHSSYNVACKTTTSDISENTAVWFGLQKTSVNQKLIHIIKKYIIYMLIVTIHAVVVLRQNQKRAITGIDKTPNVLFPNITRKDAEEDSKRFLKYIFNYGFYKFGLEITLLSLVVLISYRNDVIAIPYAVWLCILVFLERSDCAKLWPFFQWFTAILIILQYIFFVRLPPGLCIGYYWENTPYDLALQLWGLLPGSANYQPVHKLTFDFILLFCITRQRRVFYKEKKIFTDLTEYPGGTNSSVIHDIEGLGIKAFKNPTTDFITDIRNWLDVYRNAVLGGLYWVTLALLFMAGTYRSDILAIGYLVGSCIFLWQGTDFYIRPIAQILKWWNILILYNIFNIVIIVLLNLVTYFFLNSLKNNGCWIVHLLALTMPPELKDHEDNSKCPPIILDYNIHWEPICFAFLIFQLRIFKSHYFCHIINDAKANLILASRGAELIEDLRIKQIEHKKKHEQQVLLKIKKKMEKIRSNQHKLSMPEPDTHFCAISSGDYYMFHDMEDHFKLDVIERDKGDFLEDHEKKSEDAKKKSLRESKPEMAEEHLTNIQDGVIAEDHSPEKPKKTKKKLINIEDYEKVSHLKVFIRKFLSLFSMKINALSRNYRYVMKVLNQEKKILKESKSYERGIRTGATQIWTPFMYMKKHLFTKDTDPEASAITTSEGIITYDLDDKFTTRGHHIIIEVLISVWYAVISNTDTLCYCVIFLNQVVNASVVSLPLPLMVFLWGTLSLPRPTKTFWVTLIAYTQSIVFIKALFQFKSLWSNYANLPSQPSTAKIVGIEVDKRYAVFDLLLLLFLFSHRVVLKSQGLWKSENREEMYEDQNLIKDESSNTERDEPSTAQQNIENASFTSADEQSVILVTKLNTDIASESSIELQEDPPAKEPTLNVPGLTKFTCIKYFSSMRNFFYDLVYKARLPVDVYAIMFLCDFTNFFVLLFGFAAFGSQSNDTGEGVQKYLQENKVPIPFLIMLLIQFILIVIDRALYLRKALVNKIIFHFCSVIGIHIWMFFVLPAVTELKFYSLLPPVIFYVIKCIYLLLSSYQIKCGYPKRILGNFLTRRFAIWNMVAFKLYMLMPFLYELRTILDWVCTKSTMSLGDWLKMEDIFTDIFCIKCARQFEVDFPSARGSTKPTIIKLLLGGTIIVIIVILTWGPLSLFAIGNAVGQPNVPYKAAASLQIGTYDPIYQIIRDSIHSFDEDMMPELEGAYISDKQAMAFIANYDPSDIAAIIFTLNSPSLWNISPPDKQNLLDDLNSERTLICRFKYTIYRVPSNEKGHHERSSEVVYSIDHTFEGRDILINMVQGNPTTEPVIIPHIFPKFIKVLNSGNMHVISNLMQSTPLYRSLYLRIFQENEKIWWQIQEDCSDDFYKNTLDHLPHADCDSGLVMYTFNDKQFPSTFNFLTGGGIIGLYTTFVLVASKVLKSLMTGQHFSIMYVDLPYADRVLQLCLDVYLVREALEFTLEEDLFAKLIFLYRSPATMIKWTQPLWRIPDPDSNMDETFRTRSLSGRSRSITIRE